MTIVKYILISFIERVMTKLFILLLFDKMDKKCEQIKKTEVENVKHLKNCEKKNKIKIIERNQSAFLN